MSCIDCPLLCQSFLFSTGLNCSRGVGIKELEEGLAAANQCVGKGLRVKMHMCTQIASRASDSHKQNCLRTEISSSDPRKLSCSSSSCELILSHCFGDSPRDERLCRFSFSATSPVKNVRAMFCPQCHTRMLLWDVHLLLHFFVEAFAMLQKWIKHFLDCVCGG